MGAHGHNFRHITVNRSSEGSEPRMLLVVLGAGASYDSAPSRPPGDEVVEVKLLSHKGE